MTKEEAESIWILSINDFSLIRGFQEYSRSGLYKKLHQIRIHAHKSPSSGFLRSPISLWDISKYLRVDVNRLVDEKTLMKLRK